VLWMVCLGLVSCCVWQTSVMRASSAASEKVVRQTFSWGALGFLIRFMVPYFWGICAIVYIASQPGLREVFLPSDGSDPGDVTLRAMPIALAGLLPAGAIGILTAGMFAAAMSTYNTYLHTWSAVLTQDVVAPWFPKGLSSRARIGLARCIMVAIAVFLLVWGLWYPLGQNLWSYMAVTGSVYFTGAFAVLLFGIYWRRASSAGAFAAFASGFLGILALAPIQKWLGLSRLAATALHRLAEIPGLAGLGRGVDPETFKLSEGVVGLTTWGIALAAMVAFSLLMPDAPRRAATPAVGEARVEGVAT